MLIKIIITLITVILMEGITWLTHKYVIRIFMVFTRRPSCFSRYNSIFEKNDLFFVIFAVPNILLMYFGMNNGYNYLFCIGLGILIYGIFYFIVHDIIIHQRFKWFKNIKWRYIQTL